MASGTPLKGITISIGGNTGPLQAALKDVEKTSTNLQSELKEVNKLLKFDPTNSVLLAQKQKLLAESITNTGNKLDIVKEAERQAQEQFKKGKISSEQYRELQREVAKTEQSLKYNNKQIKEQTTNFDALSNKIDSKVNGAFKTLAIGIAGVVVGIGALAKSGLEGASSLEGYRTTLNVVMKDTKLAGETFAWAVDFANKTPFETESIVQATVRLTSYGLKAKEVMPAIGDMAGVMNKDIMSAVEAVADAQTGELERMKEFGITKQMIIDQGNKIMKGKELVNNKGQIVDQKNFNKAMFSLMDEKFKGGMDLQANSFKGLWSTVTGVFKTSLAMMMGISDKGEVVIGGMFDTIKSKIKIAADTLTKWSTDGTMGKIGASVQSAFSVVLSVLTDIFNFVNKNIVPTLKIAAEHIEIVKGVVVGLVAAMVIWKVAVVAATVVQEIHNAILIASALAHGGLSAATTVLTAATGGKVTATIIASGALIAHNIALVASKIAHAAAAVAMGIVTAAQWAFNVAMTANPIGLIIAALAALGLAIYAVVKHWKEICEWIKNAWDWLTKWNGTPAKDKFSTVTTTYATKGDFNKLYNSGYAPPGYASGTSFATPGLHWVGENGPELLKFRGGESVLNAKDSAKIGNGLTLNIENFVNNRAQDVENLMTESAFYFKQKNSGLGGA